jgi:DNA-binding GntR family transcriptional regulator
MKEADTKAELLQYGNNFHRAVCKSTNNSMMIALHYSISMQLLKLRQMDFLTLEVYQRGINAHQEILDAITDRNTEEAETLMKQHIMCEYEIYLS